MLNLVFIVCSWLLFWCLFTHFLIIASADSSGGAANTGILLVLFCCGYVVVSFVMTCALGELFETTKYPICEHKPAICL